MGRADSYLDDLDYEIDMEIDPYDLDHEWMNQPLLYMKYVKAAAMAKKQLDFAHEKVKRVRSDLIKQTKSLNPSMTAQQVESEYRRHSKHIAAKKKMIQAEYLHSLYSGAIFGFQQRKSALENLVRLHLSEYYSKPETPDDVDEETKKRLDPVQRTRRKANEALKKKKKRS